MISVQLFQLRAKTFVCFLSIFVEFCKILFVLYGIFFCFQTFQNLIKDFNIIVIDSEINRQFESDIISGTSLSTADTDHKVVIL